MAVDMLFIGNIRSYVVQDAHLVHIVALMNGLYLRVRSISCTMRIMYHFILPFIFGKQQG